MFSLNELSLREYLELSQQIHFRKYSLAEILNDHHRISLEILKKIIL